MSSWSCPYFRERTDHCERLHTECVPGRKGCVLPRNLRFAVPPEQRIERVEKPSTSQAQTGKD